MYCTSLLGAHLAVATRCTLSASSLRGSMCMKCHQTLHCTSLLGAHLAVATQCTPSASSLRGCMLMRCHHAVSENITSGCAFSSRHTVCAECVVHKCQHSMFMMCHHAVSAGIASGCAPGCHHTVYAEYIVPGGLHDLRLPPRGICEGTSYLVCYTGFLCEAIMRCPG